MTAATTSVYEFTLELILLLLDLLSRNASISILMVDAV